MLRVLVVHQQLGLHPRGHVEELEVVLLPRAQVHHLAGLLALSHCVHLLHGVADGHAVDGFEVRVVFQAIYLTMLVYQVFGWIERDLDWGLIGLAWRLQETQVNLWNSLGQLLGLIVQLLSPLAGLDLLQKDLDRVQFGLFLVLPLL